MLTAPGVVRIKQQYTGLFRSRIKVVNSRVKPAKRIKARDIEDVLQEILLEVWKTREGWPEDGPDSEIAYLRTIADRTIGDVIEKQSAKKRDRIDAPLWDEEDDTPDCDAYIVDAIQEEVVDNNRVGAALSSVGELLPTHLQQVFNANLSGDPIALTKYDHRATQAMLRATRRVLNLPADYPTDAGIADSADHLIRTARAIDAAAELMEETSCAGEPLAPNHESARTSDTSASASVSSPDTIGTTTSAREISPARRSLPPTSVAARYRRRAPSRSKATRATKVASDPRALPLVTRPARQRLPVVAKRKRSTGEAE